MKLSDAWMIFVFLAFTLYIVLDGYDLGIGVLTLFTHDDRRRREMHELVAWVWDGNESWLVLTALTLWAGVPLVIGVALPALYIAIVPMLWALIARGVALELIDEHEGWHRVWGPVFGIGSLLAAFCQGAAFGGLVAGFAVRGGAFVGGPFTFVHHGYAILTGLTAVALYVLAGSACLYLKTDDETQAYAARTGRIAVVALAGGTTASWLLAAAAGPVPLHPGDLSRLPVWIVGAGVLSAGLVAAFGALKISPRRDRSDHAPALATGAVYIGGLMLALGLLYPMLVPPRITVHDAASPHDSLLFLMIGVATFIPVILAYQAFVYWVFRGKVRARQGVPAR